MPTFFEKHCSHIDEMTSQVVRESSIRKAIRAVVADRQVSVSVADPRSRDAYLIAVSNQFETMTGYSRSEILGKNCRFLNAGCNVNQGDLVRLRTAVKTGESFTGVLENRRKSGELFLNLLDLHGLTVARNHASGDELWFLVGIQVDVSELSPCAMEEAEKEIHRVANDIRQKLADQLSALAISGALKFTVEVPELREQRDRLPRQLRSKELGEPRQVKIRIQRFGLCWLHPNGAGLLARAASTFRSSARSGVSSSARACGWRKLIESAAHGG